METKGRSGNGGLPTIASDRDDFLVRKEYLEQNPVKRNLALTPDAYRWSSAYKPTSAAEAAKQAFEEIGTAKAVPFRFAERHMPA